jgi:SAM-dependent methyltransferase
VYSFREVPAMTTVASGTVAVQGDLWGARAGDWAEHEIQYAPVYEDAIRRLGIGPGTSVLDLGCGAGVFLRAAADAGAEVAGVDASAPLVAIAGDRVPEADVRLGDMERLPYDEDAFDVVTSFNSFWYAAGPIAALREAGRVARPGALVLALVFGRPERCDVGAMLHVVAALAPAAHGPRSKFSLHRPGVLERMAREAGLISKATGDLHSTLEFAGEDALVRQLLSPGPVVHATRAVGEPAVRRAILESVAPFRRPDGRYTLENEWHYLIAVA